MKMIPTGSMDASLSNFFWFNLSQMAQTKKFSSINLTKYNITNSVRLQPLKVNRNWGELRPIPYGKI